MLLGDEKERSTFQLEWNNHLPLSSVLDMDFEFEPERMSIQIVARIFGAHGNASSRFQPSSLFDPRATNGGAVQDTDCSLPLSGGRFRQFWDEATKSRHIVEAVPGFEQAIQTYAIHVLSLTYQKIPRPVLAGAINIDGLSLDKFLEHQSANSGWILEKGHGRGQLIVLPRNEFNHPELKKIAADTVPLEHITRIFPILG
ncbi:Eukaryotic translation initiation factor 3 subunit K [Hibiscus syriacus]|uniref:Eukaryotic translation initiation factor 3 subunit K n=1 Tax=Hibiscus syriacus TaxID=106335 RepID=A0A6A2Y4W7_HIBSY|nr:Eukaryotic translation initiation factor 3 subunit K [Hibiscus syriacus]